MSLLLLFLSASMLQFLVERGLARANCRFFNNALRLQEARQTLGISTEQMSKALSYANDKARFGAVRSWFDQLALMIFLGLGVFGWIEVAVAQEHSLLTGLGFFAVIFLLSSLSSIPFDYYSTFVIEEKHGFNRQTISKFFGDRLKSLAIGAILGGLLLAGLLWVMDRMGEYWWIYAWLLVTFFSLFAAWIFPTVLAPLFNKFKPLEEGELRQKIDQLSQKVDFPSGGVFVMDASTRSSHGNAYFTGVFGKKRIVLFDTLIKALNAEEIVAVLAHELGHFKLHHVRWGLIRGSLTMALFLFAIAQAMHLEVFYHAFGFAGPSSHAALLVFSLWFGLLSFLIQPISSYLSRRNEFAADRFALEQGSSKLGAALVKLSEQNHSMPVVHPLYSLFYYSHPPILERLAAMESYLRHSK